YTPPELQGLAFKEIDRGPQHDYFGLAVLIFQLLFIGRHPFSGRFLGQGEMPLERAIRELRFAYGDDAEVSQMQPPPGALTWNALPLPLMGLFRRSFLTVSDAVRAQPQEWIEPMEKLAKSLKKCGLHSGHFYYDKLSNCPWCEIESRARVRLFNFMLSGANGTRKGFRLDEIWREIESIEWPNVALTPQNKERYEPVASREAVFFAEDRFARFLLALIAAALAGIFIPWISDSFMAFALLIIASIGLSRYAKAELKSASKMQTNIQGQPSITY